MNRKIVLAALATVLAITLLTFGLYVATGIVTRGHINREIVVYPTRWEDQ